MEDTFLIIVGGAAIIVRLDSPNVAWMALHKFGDQGVTGSLDLVTSGRRSFLGVGVDAFREESLRDELVS